MSTTVPDLAAILDPLLGLPYEQLNCWQLCRHLYKEGFGEDLEAQPAQAWKRVEEIWWQDDGEDPLTLSQPWDLLAFRGTGMASHHVGIVVNAQQFTHTRKRLGLCLEQTLRWRARLLQIARLRRLL
jgi:cell wall-associated NlpC family hydrolase